MSVSGNEDSTITAIDVGVIADAKAYLRWIRRQDFFLVKEETRVKKPAGKSQAAESADIDQIREAVASCLKCSLGSTRKNAVFGSGSLTARLMFVGEAPGAKEDESGLPFVGPAGKVLTSELEKHGIRREDVFITNVIKCRPPGNRDPVPEEITACQEYLHRQIDLIRPKMLCALGRYAAAILLGRPISIMKIRGTWEEYHGLPLFICLHPSAILHQPGNRALFEADIASLAERYDAAEKAGVTA